MTPPIEPVPEPLTYTPLYSLHRELGAKMVAFAGYEMPVQYRSGILAEHHHCRSKAGMFDVSHMGQARLIGADEAGVAAALERLVPADILGLNPGQAKYTQLLNEAGGIIDDLIVTRPPAGASSPNLRLVVNAGRKHIDYTYISQRLPHDVQLEPLDYLALIALQGPAAARIMDALAPGATRLTFMEAGRFQIAGLDCFISRCGYTGEDGFEISVDGQDATDLATALLAHDDVLPIGLGARDSLRLEAGLCLYGHELTEEISPVEAGLSWSIAKRRRQEGGFAGATRLLRELAEGAPRKLIGCVMDTMPPAREGSPILSGDTEIGVVTSGGFSPTSSSAIALGLVNTPAPKPGDRVDILVRGKARPATVTAIPFVAHRYFRR